VKGVASLRNTREVRKLTQEELLEEAKITGKIKLFNRIESSFFFVFSRGN
jgi:transcriptional regulator with XRE-family HTH domain